MAEGRYTTISDKIPPTLEKGEAPYIAQAVFQPFTACSESGNSRQNVTVRISYLFVETNKQP